MDQVDPNSTRRKGLWATLAIATVTSASAVTIALPATSNGRSRVPTPVPPTTTAPPPAPRRSPHPPPASPAVPPAPAAGRHRATPTRPPPPPVDPNAPPPPAVDPNAGRVTNAVGGFSFVLPAGWVESDASHLDYGSALLSKTTGQPPMPGQPPPVANDTRIVIGRLDQKLYASAEANNTKAAVRLGSDMGEFFMPYPGTRINQDSHPARRQRDNRKRVVLRGQVQRPGQAERADLDGRGRLASATNAGPPQRWFVVWLGTANDPVDKGAAKALAESIQPWTAPARLRPRRRLRQPGPGCTRSGTRPGCARSGHPPRAQAGSAGH